MNPIFSRGSPLWLALALAAAVSIVYFSLSRTIVEIPGDAGGRFGHTIAYASLMFMAARCAVTARSRIAVAAALVAAGACIELLQWRTGYRSFEYADMMANAVGITIGWLSERTLAIYEGSRRLPVR